MTRLDKEINTSVLAELLGADGITELKSKVIDIIVDSIKEQLHESSYYIVSPDDISNDIYNDVITEIKDEIMTEYKTKVKEVLDKRFETTFKEL